MIDAPLRPRRQRVVAGRATVVDEQLRAGVLDVEGGAERVHASARRGDERHRRLVNSACPGWVRTDMGGRDAPRSVEQGADTIVWLATLDAEGADRRVLQRSKADRLVIEPAQFNGPR